MKNITDPQTSLTAEVVVNASIEKVWAYWTMPNHIKNWNNTSDEWHTPVAENDLQEGGKLFLRMETKDGSAGFDHECVYDEVLLHKKISYTTSDHRKSIIYFTQTMNGIQLTEIFEPEATTPLALQQSFCQSILDNFRKYVEDENK